MKGISLTELQAEYKRVTLEKIRPGSVILTDLDESDGLTYTDGRSHKPRRVIIIGYDKENKCFIGTVFINTNINPKAKYSAEFLATQIMVKKDEYPNFLKHDSFIDCGQLMPLHTNKLLSGEYKGEVVADDFHKIMATLKNTETIPAKEKRRFGII